MHLHRRIVHVAVVDTGFFQFTKNGGRRSGKINTSRECDLFLLRYSTNPASAFEVEFAAFCCARRCPELFLFIVDESKLSKPVTYISKEYYCSSKTGISLNRTMVPVSLFRDSTTGFSGAAQVFYRTPALCGHTLDQVDSALTTERAPCKAAETL